ncbi:stage III sporulation protein AE [Paenibacillus albiflavus]|uniref:Stage III sporulation protein AE n=2 Tax=Paenibacillus albiflavus TaxID=2545760 RepID=A0A4R4EHA1_9BACL|nr:stage III sporulation protein AE [Paenibacillus albiflavus]
MIYRSLYKRIAIMIIIMISLLTLSNVALAASPSDAIVKDQITQIDTGPIEQYWDRLMSQNGNFFPELQTPSFTELLTNGGQGLSISNVFKGTLRYIFYEVLANGKLLVTIVILTVFAMMLQTLQSSFERESVSTIAFVISYLVLIIIAVNSFSSAIGYAKNAITSMIDFMIALVPLLLTLLSAMGDLTSVALLHPLNVFMIHTVGAMIYFFVFPLLFFSAVLHIVSAISDKYKVTQLANLLRNIGVGALGIFVTVFMSVITVQGSLGAVSDGITIRTAKFITGNFVPVVGRLFSDATETVIGASLLVKNAIGLAGIVIIIMLCLFPALKILTLAIIFNLSAAIMQPIGNNPMISCLKTIGKSMIYVFAALAAVGLMFFFSITVMIAAGNLSVMVR